MISAQQVTVAAIGSLTWDRLNVVEQYPAAGDTVLVEKTLEAPGGNTGNFAVALARLGVSVALAAVVGNDELGRRLRTSLQSHAIDTRWITIHPTEPTDDCTIIVSRAPANRTIFWRKGARYAESDAPCLTSLFAHPILMLDVDDPKLLRSLLSQIGNLAAARPLVMGTLQYSVGTASRPGFPDALELALCHHVVTGNEMEWTKLTETSSVAAAVEAVQRAMNSAALRAFFVTMGSEGCLVCTKDKVTQVPAVNVQVADTTGAGDAFAAGVAYGLTRGWEWEKIGRFGNVVGGLSTRALGAQSALPTASEAYASFQPPME